jgi:hypothetical protein
VTSSGKGSGVAEQGLDFRLTATDLATAVLRKVRGELDGVGQTAGSLKGVFTGLAPALAGVFTGAGIVALTKATINGLDSLNDLADATGATVEKLSALEDVALRTGSTMDVATDIVLKLNKALESADPNSNIEEAFQAIGLQVAELKKLDPAEMTLKVAQALAKYADNGNKARIEAVLLGKLTKEGAAYMKDLGEQTELVAKRTKEETDAAEKLNKEFFALKTSVVNLSRDLAGPLVTGLNKAIEGYRLLRKERQLWQQLLLGPFAPPFREGGATGEWEPEKDDRPSAPEIKDKATEKRLSDAAKKAADERRKLRVEAAEAELKVEEMAAQDTAEAWSYYNKKIIADSEEKDAALKLQTKQYFEWIDQQQQEQIEEGQAYLASLKQTGDKVGEDLALVFSSAAGEAIANFKNLRDVLKGVLADIAQIAIRETVTKPLAALATTFFSGLSFRAAGGPVSSGMPYIVGERGPELFVPSASGRITANGAGGGMVLQTTIHIDSRTDQAQVAQLVAGAMQQTEKRMWTSMRARGVA